VTDTDTIYIAVGEAGGRQRGGVYHTDPQCPGLQCAFDTDQITPADLRRERELCRRCDTSHSQTNGTGDGHIDSLRETAIDEVAALEGDA
jgi:hypothetical protein